MKKRYSIFRWLKDVSIAKKLYFTVGIMALLIGIELFTLIFALNTLSSVRAYVGGEGLWSKAQKDALFHLYKYGIDHNEADYLAFKEYMKVPIGDGKGKKGNAKTGS
jgi:two-component system, sensor histidine kinase